MSRPMRASQTARLWASARRSLQRSMTLLRTPRQWPWKWIGAGAGLCGAAGIAIASHESSRARSLRQSRVFNEGSPLQSMEASLRTGDVLLFSRSPFPLDGPDGSPGSWMPLRIAIVLAQKIAGGSEHDHAALIMRRNDYPYVLERSWNGSITLRPFEDRMLHSSAQEVVLRRLEGPELTEQDEARIDAWLARLMGEEAANAVPAASSASAAAAASSGTSSPSSPAPASSPSSDSKCISPAPRISPWSLLAHLLWCNTLGGSSSATSSSRRAQPIVTLGHITELWAEMQQLALRIEALQEREDAAAAARGEGRRATQSVSSVTGSTTTLQRLQVRQREVVNRLKQLQQSLESYPAPASTSASTGSGGAATNGSALADPLADAELHRVCDFPSAALVARGLQVVGVLPEARAAQSTRESLVLSMQPDTGAAAASPAPAPASSLPTLSIPGARVPPISAYAPRHFLSASRVPLLHMQSLQQRPSAHQSVPVTAAAVVTATATAPPSAPGSTPSSRLRVLPDVFFHREMFLKTKYKSLPFTVEE